MTPSRGPRAGFPTVTPRIVTTDLDGLVAFLRDVFGATGDVVAGRPAELRIGDSLVMLSDAVMEPARPANLFLYVPKVDKTFAKAVKAGAKVLAPVEDAFWGDRWGRIEDPLGNRWSIATRVEDVSKKKLKKRMAKQAQVQAAAAN